ncbi:PAS domain-containing sensor histidine kinase [Iodidimonas sp. SYSU 1G8]|uniref:sensor histidine kinase NtrY-like n=1 Tax=Iodidimonas sp. SYSU 1G8 TaxID=3133967 RepID=UPI0031FE58C7
MSSLSGTPDRPKRVLFPSWIKQLGRSRWTPITLAAIAILWGIGTYAVLSSGTLAMDSNGAIALIFGNLAVVVVLAMLIMRRMVRLWVARRSGAAGSRLHVRLVTLLSLVAIIPTIIVAMFSALYFNLGFQNWFSDQVRGAVHNSVRIAEDYMEEHKKSISRDLLEMSAMLNTRADEYRFEPDRLIEEMENQARGRGFSEAIILSRNGTIVAKYNGLFGDTMARTSGIPRRAMAEAEAGAVATMTNANDDYMGALIKLSGYLDRYLYVGRNVDQRVVEQLEKTKHHAAEYEQLEQQRASLQTKINIMFVVLALLMLMIAVFVGIWFASRLIAPISDLVRASERIRGGDLGVRVHEGEGDDEITVLSRTFNRMTNQLQSQRNELIDANIQLDQRRRFTEAVLEGVLVGVIGLNARGEVDLSNRAGLSMLEETESAFKGTRLVDTVPELTELLSEAEDNPDQFVQQQINILREGRPKNLLVRISSERVGGEIAGFVVTFDDITELVAAQRTAAWADVARRIAHEIKNPLTPIQLSAERLKRKYRKEIQTDPDVFTHCTDTIIRQVGDIRRMVDEFSGFARMPAPTFREENIAEIARQTLLFLEVSWPDIDFVWHGGDQAIMLNCDGRQVAQALTNIIKNAAESIQGRKCAEGESLPRGHIDLKLTEDAASTVICVEDNGLGLPREHRARLTEPYVTTREKGTGLGLAIVKKIMSDHGGELLLDDRPSSGVRVRLVFSREAARDLAHKSETQVEKRAAAVG